MDKNLRRSQRAIPAVNYSRLNSVGKQVSTDEMAAKGEDQEDHGVMGYDENQDEFFEEEGLEPVDVATSAEWQARREAVSDENFQKQYDAFQAKMRELNERELVIERENKLQEMRDQMLEREKKIRVAERELASKNARYEEVDTVQSKLVQTGHWVNKQNAQKQSTEKLRETRTIGKPSKGKGVSVKFKGTDKREGQAGAISAHNLDIADALVNDDYLEQCRFTGTSRLNTLGLSRQQSDSRLQQARRPSPMVPLQQWSRAGVHSLGAVTTEPAAQNKSAAGNGEDGESILSFRSGLSEQGARSDTSEKKKEKKLKSGMYDKVANDVVFKLKWPHKRLSRVWVPERVQPGQMTFEQVVAGEIAVILRSSNLDEVRARLQILQKVAYWNMQGQGWPRVRDVYMAILHSIEEGEASFDSTFGEYDQVFPVRTTSTKFKPGFKREVFWCRDFNRGSCAQDSGHKAMIAGTERVVQHICAACWKVGKKEKHKDTDPGCPQKEL